MAELIYNSMKEKVKNREQQIERDFKKNMIMAYHQAICMDNSVTPIMVRSKTG